MAGKSLDEINGLTWDDKTVLTRAAAITSVEELWSGIAKNPDLIKSLPFPNDDAKERVMTQAANYAGQRSRSITRSFLADHLPDAVVGVLLFLLVLALCSFYRSPAITAKGVIPAFHVITEADVLKMGTDPDSYLLQKIVGRYPTDPIPAENVINPSNLSRGPRLSNELDGLRILNVKLQPTHLLRGVVPPVKLNLIVSAAALGNPQIYTVYLLDSRLQPDGSWAVIGAREYDAKTLASASQLSVAGPVRAGS